MKTLKNFSTILVLCTVLLSVKNYAQTTTNQNHEEMKTYVIEREIPNVGTTPAEELVSISKKSCAVIEDIGPKIQWLHSYVTENKIYCVYKAQSKEIIKEHASKGGFPVNSISELSTTISPETAKD
ncbi:MAG TPA: DUF4242 domain-containing protein [Flavobacteriaceae bacterium]|nr:DUF4242 domain-containing protein [Flavobacteriaceae bacterium]